VDMEPEEAVELRRGLAGPGLQTLSRERRLELAVVAVKRAFSEFPSISALVDALLQYPLYELHTVCRLRTGIPVAPMLAKPTKKLEEVLQRLSGQLFTMEYKYDGERAQVTPHPDIPPRLSSRVGNLFLPCRFTFSRVCILLAVTSHRFGSHQNILEKFRG